jgi:hypothetical protein
VRVSPSELPGLRRPSGLSFASLRSDFVLWRQTRFDCTLRCPPSDGQCRTWILFDGQCKFATSDDLGSTLSVRQSEVSALHSPSTSPSLECCVMV